MARFLFDENFKGAVIRGLLRREPGIDLVRAVDVGLGSTPDPVLLEWAAREDRLLITHDARTMTFFAYERVRAGLRMPGLFEASEHLGVGQVIEQLLLIDGASLDREWDDQVRYLPLR